MVLRVLLWHIRIKGDGIDGSRYGVECNVNYIYWKFYLLYC